MVKLTEFGSAFIDDFHTMSVYCQTMNIAAPKDVQTMSIYVSILRDNLKALTLYDFS